MSDTNVTQSIVILIEWGGNKPSSTWYNRLHSYGLYSRMPQQAAFKQEFNLMEWRAGQKGDKKREDKRGMVLQEGVIVVTSMTLAEDIARWAKAENKAALVQIGHMTVADFIMSKRDYKAFAKIQQAVSKRGPKPAGESGFYAVTCFDEVKTFATELEAMPMMCPMCGGSNIQSRMGQVHVYQQYTQAQGDMKEYWLRTRFSNGNFEVPSLKENDGKIYPTPKQTVNNVTVPELLIQDEQFFQTFSRNAGEYFHMMDVLYCVSKLTATRRLEGRLRVIDAYARAGGQSYLMFNPPANGIDLLDLCILEDAYKAYL